MKTIPTPLKHPKTILIVVIFFTLFLILSLIVPVQTALGKGDEDFDSPTGNSSSGGGTSNDSKSSSGGSGSSNNNSQKDEDQNPNAGGGGSSGGSSNSKDKGEKDNSQSGGGGSTSGGSSNNNSHSNNNDHNDNDNDNSGGNNNSSNNSGGEYTLSDYSTVTTDYNTGLITSVSGITSQTMALETAEIMADLLNENNGTVANYSPSVFRDEHGNYTASATQHPNNGGGGNNDNTTGPPPTHNPPTATISATNCIIASGASTCYANLTWNIEDATNPNVRNTTNPNPMILSILATGVSVPRAIFYGQNTIVARDSTTVLATTFAKAICASGSVWIGTQCGPKTDLNPVSPTIVPQCAATDSPCPASTVSFTIYNAGAPISAGTNVPYRIEYRAQWFC